ncbi:MAG: caa(3)-type oxidase, subunit [Verrucomicrobiales bacterium]|nr:caa(3)-type oxidase, subunit [Verrucomicrobiales bacterium]
MSSHIVSIKTYLLVWAILMVLLFLTLGLAELNLSPFNVAVALAVAALKMLLIILYFMHVKFSSRLTWLFAMAGFLWLGFMLVLTLSDYFARGMPVE